MWPRFAAVAAQSDSNGIAAARLWIKDQCDLTGPERKALDPRVVVRQDGRGRFVEGLAAILGGRHPYVFRPAVTEEAEASIAAVVVEASLAGVVMSNADVGREISF